MLALISRLPAAGSSLPSDTVDAEAEQPDAPGSGIDGDEDAAAGRAEAEAAMQAVLAGGVAQVVYRSAIASVPQDLPFRARFLAALEQFQFSGEP